MSFLFKRNPRTPQEVVRSLNEQISKIDLTNDNHKKYQDDCARFLKQMKVILNGDDETEPQPDQITLLAQEIYQTDCLYYLITNLSKLNFDSRKDVSILFSNLLRRKIGNQSPTVDYLINSKPEIIMLLIKGQVHHEIGLICGSIIRDCIKFEVINSLIIASKVFWNYFGYVQSDIFEVATDSFTTLHDLLTLHKKLVSEFLTSNYDQFNKNINQLIQSKNYVVKRQSVRLLSELVLTRTNQNFLNRYFDDTINLKVVMLLLSDKSKNLQIEGFHIFKFFIAKPKKSQKIMDILIKNKSNFIEFLEKFDLSSLNDSTIIDEKDYVWNEIKKLPEIERL
ncbi:Hym1p [Yamadazyma tenuis]|uniref:Mo25-like protein n=1 Tax=Candida tenuis (strain ATCC 10573 / BCRC 21748 / CBS 615 / JCM 9827 / NBRC 10315 / NRRL Y-1498 / VKM Y-70) TaxID=590646 RepID=G3B9J9_CANTC|nr:Mo25-like protein [Yamadazyma tenuis ATCC 10573]EGV61908.1 Mo25-like protein [Yamadazyma tenuis ATCC 10573]WEJ93142.1 Hym1p [Yamadazyma tenuis]